MPHKRNPVDAVLLVANGLRARGLARDGARRGARLDARPAGEWHAEWQAWRELLRLAAESAARARPRGRPTVVVHAAGARTVDAAMPPRARRPSTQRRARFDAPRDGGDRMTIPDCGAR